MAHAHPEPLDPVWDHRLMPRWLRRYALNEGDGTRIVDMKSGIRIVHLHPGSENDVIKCDLEVISLDNPNRPAYEAVSYVWGQSLKKRKIMVGDKSIPATDNLYDALRHLRLPRRKRILWIDQLCIKQWDTGDKNHQVALMGRIYKSCARCQIWIGDFRNASPPLSQSEAQVALNFVSDFAGKHTDYDPPPDETMDAFVAFTAAFNVWFSRIWTVQEAHLPEESIVNWGAVSIDWAMIRATGDSDVLQLFFGGDYYNELHELKSNLSKMYQLRDLFHAQRYRDAHDPRDKIYGLLGLLSPGYFPGVPQADYTLETHRLFTIVTIDMIAKADSLAPITRQGSEPHVTPGLPSWAVDFVPHSDPQQRNVRYIQDDFRYRTFDASAGKELCWTEWNNQNYAPVLRLYSLEVDIITATAPGISCRSDRDGTPWSRFPVDGNAIIQFLREAVDHWLELVNGRDDLYPLGQYPATSEPWKTAFCRTVHGDIVSNDRMTEREIEAGRRFVENSERGELQLRSALFKTMAKRSFFITSTGFFGYGPPAIAVGDEVRLFAGCRSPVFIREYTDESFHGNNHYKFLGDGYVHGIMDGEFARAHDEHSWNTVWLH